MKDGVAIIHYELNGALDSWPIGCDIDVENEETIRAHLMHWMPRANFVSVEFQPVERSKEIRNVEMSTKCEIPIHHHFDAMEKALKKLIDPGMDGRAVLAAIEEERAES